METKIENLKDNKIKVTTTVAAKDVDARIAKVYKDFSHKYNFPGFRKGHVPRPVIDANLGQEAVSATVTDDVINETYPLIIDDNDLHIVGKPEFENEDLVEAGKPYEIVFTASVAPTYELSSYEQVEIELPKITADEETIQAQIDDLREHYFTLEDAPAKAKVEKDSQIEFAMETTGEDGNKIDALCSKSRIYTLGSGLFNEAFDSEVEGLAAGAKKDFSLNIEGTTSAFLAPYTDENKTLDVHVEILSIKKKMLPELTDEWVKETLQYEDIADLKNRIKESIESQLDEYLPRLKENKCLEALAERISDDIPESVTEEYESNLMQDFFRQLQAQQMTFDAYLKQLGMTSENFKEDIKKQAVDVAKQDLALDAWARNKKILASEEDVLQEFERAEIKDPKKALKEWRERGQLHLIREGILRTKALNDVMDNAKITEVKVGKAQDADKLTDEGAEEKTEKKSTKKKTTKAKTSASTK